MTCAQTPGMKSSLWALTFALGLAAMACGGHTTQATTPVAAAAPPPAAAPEHAPTPRPISTEILVARYVAPSEQAKLDAEKAEQPKSTTGGTILAASVPDEKPAPKTPAKKKKKR